MDWNDVSTDRLVEAVKSGKMTRRDMNAALASVGLASVVIPLMPRSAKAATEDEPVVFTWSGYEEDGLHVRYDEKYGESPNYSFFGDEEEALAKIRAGFKPDISMPCSYKVTKWRDAGVLAPIDETRLSVWPDIIEQLKNVPDIVVDGKRWWVCMDLGQTSILYRTDLVDPKYEDHPTWGLMGDEANKGRMAMIDSLIDGVMVAAIYSGAKNPFDMTEAEVAKVRKLLKQQLPLLRFYSNDMTSVQQALASGELVAAVTWNDSFMSLTEQGLPVKWMKPKEGLMTWTCGITLMADADPAKLDRSYDFIDAMLSPEAGVYEIENWGYGHANRKAYEQVSEDDLRVRGLSKNPEEFLSGGIFQAAIQNEPELQTMFEEVKAGA